MAAIEVINTTATGTVTRVYLASTRGRDAAVINHGPAGVEIGDSSLTIGSGFYIPPFMDRRFFLDATQDIYLVRADGVNCSVQILLM